MCTRGWQPRNTLHRWWPISIQASRMLRSSNIPTMVSPRIDWFSISWKQKRKWLIGFLPLFAGTAFTVVWENVSLQDHDKDGSFTFSVSLYDTGDITFAYKSVPMLIEQIVDDKHPVKIGLSDAYIIDHTIFCKFHVHPRCTPIWPGCLPVLSFRFCFSFWFRP